ncbi:hypothetical protein Back11_36850 [Paenibacillus baekrokdamisoli]|uniref:Uncharacterized protein n=1 Tax=Paenibacillus baekrokdamisoli TaxID=1712516 RepID=A0A3G9ITZ1_9BACL|nr:S-layer homology domain-containing protein [Paenibacillus baekrokdamisoli]MBB3072608.1 hypothetical protein [Paenibacillus baekrokdamisoli]BBH22340.1 hypothetical protein Back11_36850 [Paenibacillus baekrokdamisoli]
MTIPQVSSAKNVEVQLNGELLKLMYAKSHSIRFETERATVILPVTAINVERLLASLGNPSDLSQVNIKLSISLAEASSSHEALLTPVEFAITGSYAGKTVKVDKFERYVERQIKLSADINPMKVTTGVLIGKDGTMSHVPTKIEQINGVYYARINSLYNGIYTLVSHRLAFEDTEHHWSKAAVQDLASRLVVLGVGKDRYLPDRTMTRAEFAAILIRGLGLQAGSGTTPFTDVKIADWYSDVVQTAYEYGLINGFEDGKFRPGDLITREQAMLIITKAMKITGLKAKLTSKAADELLGLFADEKLVSVWAKSASADSLHAGIIMGRSSTELAPKAYMTRSEAAAIIQRLLQKSELI